MKYLEMRTVIARFEGNVQDYAYFVPEGDEPKVGDYLVTSTAWATETGAFEDDGTLPPRHLRRALTTAKIARVARVETTANPKATKFYVQLLSFADLVARKEANDALVTTIAVRAEAKAKLDKMLAERNVIDRYRELATVDPEAAALLKILEG